MHGKKTMNFEGLMLYHYSMHGNPSQVCLYMRLCSSRIPQSEDVIKQPHHLMHASHNIFLNIDSK